MAFKNLAERLKQRQELNLIRHRRVVSGPQDVNLCIDGMPYLAFCSNDYLGLANHPLIVKSFQDAANHYGVGSGASHLISGHSVEHHQLEEELADFVGRSRVLLFSTGYMANLGAITALVQRGDAVFEDRLNHASLLDGGLSSGARFKRYRHNDVGHLSTLLQASSGANRLVVTDTVFSMDGDIAPLSELAHKCREHDAWLMVDDAHGFGVLGDNGQGALAEANLSEVDVPVLMGTLSKAAGSSGAFIAGSDELIEALIQFARPYIYTTAMPPATAAASRMSLRIIKKESWRREKLRYLIQYFKTKAQSMCLPLMASDTAIQPIVIGDAQRAMSISQGLANQGILVTAIRPPTVPDGSSRLRITLSANHEEEHVDHLLTRLCDLMQEMDKAGA